MLVYINALYIWKLIHQTSNCWLQARPKQPVWMCINDVSETPHPLVWMVTLKWVWLTWCMALLFSSKSKFDDENWKYTPRQIKSKTSKANTRILPHIYNSLHFCKLHKFHPYSRNSWPLCSKLINQTEGKMSLGQHFVPFLFTKKQQLLLICLSPTWFSVKLTH